ncbi:hypothetical protein ACU8V7_23600 [Zobellia nedashkovskayae]
MIETIELRNKPELKIILNADEFEVIDAAKPRNNGKYLFRKIRNVELSKERTDWLVSSIAFLASIFTHGNLETYKNRANLTLETDSQTLKIWLGNADYEKAQSVMRLIKSKKAFI